MCAYEHVCMLLTTIKYTYAVQDTSDYHLVNALVRCLQANGDSANPGHLERISEWERFYEKHGPIVDFMGKHPRVFRLHNNRATDVSFRTDALSLRANERVDAEKMSNRLVNIVFDDCNRTAIRITKHDVEDEIRPLSSTRCTRVV